MYIRHLLLLAAIVFTLPTLAQSTLFKTGYKIQHGDSLPYRVLEPLHYQSSKKYPVVLFLHGSGARGNDNEKQLTNVPAIFTDSLVRANYPCFVVAPQCPKDDVWVNFPAFPNSLHATDTPTTAARLVLALVDELLQRPDVDKDRIYITGYSMGGEGTFDLIGRSHVFAAAVPVCSVADTAKATVIKNIPIWVFHGSDDNVNPVIYSQMMVQALKASGGAPEYTEYAGEGHRIWSKAYNEPGLFPWLFAQRKNK